MKWELCTFGKTAEQDQNQRRRVTRVGLNLRTQAGHLAQFIRAGNLAKQHEAAQHGQATASGDCQRHACAFARISPMLPVADQQKRRNTGELPEHDQQQKVV